LCIKKTTIRFRFRIHNKKEKYRWRRGRCILARCKLLLFGCFYFSFVGWGEQVVVVRSSKEEWHLMHVSSSSCDTKSLYSVHYFYKHLHFTFAHVRTLGPAIVSLTCVCVVSDVRRTSEIQRLMLQ